MMIVFEAGRPGRTSLGLFLLWTPCCQESPLTSGGGGVVVCSPPPVTSLASGPSGPACSGGEGRRLASAAYVDLLHQWRLVSATVAVVPLPYPPELAL